MQLCWVAFFVHLIIVHATAKRFAWDKRSDAEVNYDRAEGILIGVFGVIVYGAVTILSLKWGVPL